MPSLFMIFIAVLCAAGFSLCDALAAHWGKNGSMAALVGSLVLGPLAYLGFGYLNITIDLTVVGGIVNPLIVVFTTLAGLIFFSEDLSWIQYSGLGLIIVGIFMVVMR